MECFNCNEQATTRLSVEPDFGEIYTCSSQDCKDKARSDIERFESMKYQQGKRKDQVELSEKVVAWSIIAIIMATCFITLASIINKL
jgi:hypothetical protein